MFQWKFQKLEVKGHISGFAATTNKNRYGERQTKARLEDWAENAVGALLNHNHKYHKLPLGRTIKAEVIPIEDGQWGCKTVNEVYVDPDFFKGRGGFSIAGAPAQKIDVGKEEV